MILCVGEILVDLIGTYNNGVFSYNRYAGGAPFNVACGILKQNADAGFVGSVGDDLVGDFLIDFAKNRNFNLLSLEKDLTRNTTLAFVELDDSGERKFSFYRKNTADYNINCPELESKIEKANIVHVGSLMLSEESGRKFADTVYKISKEKGKFISFDVNFRDDIFPSFTDAVSIYEKYIKNADILKFSEDEIAIFSKNNNISDITTDNQLVFVTLGEKGSVARYGGIEYFSESISVKVKDTTGAGDAFFAGVLSKLDKKENFDLSKEKFENILKYGNICGALTATKYGAIDASPTIEEVLEIFNEIK